MRPNRIAPKTGHIRGIESGIDDTVDLLTYLSFTATISAGMEDFGAVAILLIPNRGLA